MPGPVLMQQDSDCVSFQSPLLETRGDFETNTRKLNYDEGRCLPDIILERRRIETGDFEMNWARVRIAVIGIIVFAIFIQIFQPKRTNPPCIPSRTIEAHVQIPEDVRGPLRRACGDCHSNQTVWPWYSHVAPISWVVVDDVNQGRRHMNFDDWEALGSAKEATDRLMDICKETEQKGMPPYSYRIAHPKSLLNAKELSAVCSWSNSFAPNTGK
jgi:Haem-binding domain